MLRLHPHIHEERATPERQSRFTSKGLERIDYWRVTILLRTEQQIQGAKKLIDKLQIEIYFAATSSKRESLKIRTMELQQVIQKANRDSCANVR